MTPNVRSADACSPLLSSLTITSASAGRLMLVPALRSGPGRDRDVDPAARGLAVCGEVVREGRGVRVAIAQALAERGVELLADEGPKHGVGPELAIEGDDPLSSVLALGLPQLEEQPLEHRPAEHGGTTSGLVP